MSEEQKIVPCPACKGTGFQEEKNISWRCHGCRGEKYIERSRLNEIQFCIISQEDETK